MKVDIIVHTMQMVNLDRDIVILKSSATIYVQALLPARNQTRM